MALPDERMNMNIWRDPQSDDAEVWITRDGERLAVQDMTDAHLDNAIRLIECNAPSGWKPRLYPQLLDERNRRAVVVVRGQFKRVSVEGDGRLEAPAPVRRVRLITILDEEV